MRSTLRFPPALKGEELKEAITQCVQLHLGKFPCRVYLFGSEARGSSRRSSDIDLAIESERPIPYGKVLDLREALEKLRTLREFDIVDLSIVDRKFRTLVSKQGKLIHVGE